MNEIVVLKYLTSDETVINKGVKNKSIKNKGVSK